MSVTRLTTIANPNHSRIGYRDAIELLSATTSKPERPAAAAGWWTTYEYWQPTSYPATLTATFAEQPIDYIALLHTLDHVPTIEIEEAGSWVAVDIDEIDNQPLMLLFASRQLTGVRVTIEQGAIIKIIAGLALTMDRPFFGGHSPSVLSRDGIINVTESESGEILGMTHVPRGRSTSFSWGHLKADWYRTNFDPFVAHCVEHPFFIAWNPLRADDCAYCHATKDIQPANSGGRDWMSVDVPVKVWGPGEMESAYISFLAVAHEDTPFVTIYSRAGGVFTKLTNPETLPASTGLDVAFSSDNLYMAVAHITTPFVTIYKRDGDTFTKLANPTDLPASTARGVAFSRDDVYMAVAHDLTPYITIYKRDGDTFTKLANPTDLPANVGYDVSFSGNGDYLAASHSLTPFVTIYKRDGDTFTKLANPANLPAGAARSVAFSSSDVYVAVPHSGTPFVTIYKRDGDVFTKLTNPANLPASTGWSAAFSSSDVYMAVAHNNTPFVTIYKRDGDTFTKLANPADLPPEDSYGVAFSADDRYMAVAHFSTPFVTIYKRDGDVFTKLTNPETLPASTGFGLSFSSLEPE